MADMTRREFVGNAVLAATCGAAGAVAGAEEQGAKQRPQSKSATPAYDLQRHPHFVPWVDPRSGIRTFLLDKRVSPVQQTFYFVNPSISADGRFLWFYSAWDPAPRRTLSVVSLDPKAPLIRNFPHAMPKGCPLVAPEGNAIYFCMRESVYKMDLDGKLTKIVRLDKDFIRGRKVGRLVSHLTMSADGKHFLLDGAIGNHWYVGLGEIETGKVKILKEFARHYNHAQFSPVDPELFLIAQDWWHDPVSGQRFAYNKRIWLMRTTSTQIEPLAPRNYIEGPPGSYGTAASHEWWSKDGKLCWIDYGKGAYECDVETRQATHVWKRPLCHGHCDPTRRFWTADQSPYLWNKVPCKILFWDRELEKGVEIMSGMPEPPIPRRRYHLDPHPQFSPQGNHISFTASVRGKVDVAVTPVEDIRAKLG